MNNKNKLAFMKSARQNFVDKASYMGNMGQARYVDEYKDDEKKGIRIPFKHSWDMLTHMHHLRLWTIAYAPSRTGNLQRLQELHRINNEANYLISNSLYKRILIGIFLFMFINKIGKHRFLNNGSKDSHDTYWRDVTAHL